MAAFSDYLEAELLEHLFGIDAGYAQPAIYVAASTADPLDTGAGLAEPVGNGYARVSFTDWVRAINVVSNNSDIVFPAATGAWGTITHFAIMDAASGGNVLLHGSISPSQAIILDNTLVFKAGELDVSLD